MLNGSSQLPLKLLLILMFNIMKTEKEFTVIGRAMATIAGFDRVYRTLEQQVVLRGQAKSTFENYIHRIAQVSLHFNRLPEEISAEELNEYLASLAVSAISPSRSAFKHSVYGLRYYYRYVGCRIVPLNFLRSRKTLSYPVFSTRMNYAVCLMLLLCLSIVCCLCLFIPPDSVLRR